MSEPTYTLWVKTGDEALGGTDSNVFVMLIGESGRTEWVYLPPEDIFAFEQGSTDKFILDVPDLGNLTQCCVGHDASADSGWYVEYVRVKHNTSGTEWKFVFNEWLGKEESGRTAVCVTC